METYGSMDKREKTDFILEQMRLCIAKDDYTRAQILSKKISVKFFDDVANQVCRYMKSFPFLASAPNIISSSSLSLSLSITK